MLEEVSTPEGEIMICGWPGSTVTRVWVVNHDGGEAVINLSRYHLIELADHIQNRIREIEG